jgi:hypothetical protein
MADFPTLETVKKYLRVFEDFEDDKLEGMILRARDWVEHHTGLATEQRAFLDYGRPRRGQIELRRGPIVSINSVLAGDTPYNDFIWSGGTNTLHAGYGSLWPVLGQGEVLAINYTAGFDEGEIPDQLVGAILALIEGEFSEGFAYPARSVTAAERACQHQKEMVA